MDKNLIEMLKQLRLWRLLSNWDEILSAARKGRFSHERLLQYVFEEVGLFFTLLQRRHQTKTTLITSNLGFSEWGSFLKNPQLTSALIDRLTAISHVIT